MPEPITVTGAQPVEHLGVKVAQLPQEPWEYRVLDHGGGYVTAEICCLLATCKGLVILRLDASGQNSIGTAICRHCGKKAYSRINGKWFEVS